MTPSGNSGAAGKGAASEDVPWGARAPGLVKVLNAYALGFPNRDGNGMFKSMGNIDEATKVVLVFIDPLPRARAGRGEHFRR